MIDRAALVAALRKQLAGVEADLRTLTDEVDHPWGQQLRAEYEKARAVGRTALTWTEWREGEVAQAGVAWVLGAVFVRFCEDNGLLDHPFIASAGARLAEATDAETHFYRDDPSRNTRDWLREGFSELAKHPATRGLVDPAHSPVWTAPLSADACADILRFWRAQEANGSLTWSLADPDWDTRFLGDLYQDLSEFAKKKYALLQTPDFVEEFILDRTLTSALEQVPLAELRLIDPTCGSGHFLLGAFQRLLDAWMGEAPAMDDRERIQKVLESVNGVDINPFAVAIARFRLTLAAFKAAGVTRLEGSPSFRPRVAVGDSLLASRPKQMEIDFGVEEPDSVLAAHRYAAEDVDEYQGILERGRYHVVVGNPPYITVKDKALNEAYRRAYPMCHRQYALTVPFMELFFQLATRDGVPGWVGQITSNSFMKREFGKKVIEQLLSGRDPGNPVDLTTVIDTSGAYIPGHGTPTVILIGRHRRAEGETVQAVLGIRGEPGQPADPAKGLVWSEIVANHARTEHDGTYVSVRTQSRSLWVSHPWSMSGGSAAEVKALIDAAGNQLRQRISEIGAGVVTREDSAYAMSKGACLRKGVDLTEIRAWVEGESVRDYTISRNIDWGIWPYEAVSLEARAASHVEKVLWPNKRTLSERVAFGASQLRRGLKWFEYSMFFRNRYRVTYPITFAEVATHNHFVLVRGAKVFNRTAPVIMLPEGVAEHEHLALLAVLNSSVACFWLKQVCHNKGSTVDAAGARQTTVEWENFYQFNGSKVQAFPLPSVMPLTEGPHLDALAQTLQSQNPASICESGVPTRQRLDDARAEYDAIRAQMIAWQEELDWHCYALYGLIDEDLTTDNPPPLRLGQRAFEIALARKVAAGEEETAWFERHGSTPITEIPSDWPDDYKQLVQKRLDLIENDRSINLLERPEYKRRWASESWDSMEKAALTAYVLDRLEQAHLWSSNGAPQTLTVAQLADAVRHDEGVQAGLDLLYGANADRVKAIAALMAEEAVPYLAAYRYKPSGLTKRAEWEAVWDLQRREDAGETVDIPVPPKYASTDFRKPAYWKARGKLDVPKERFIAYPGAERANDPTPVYGWAGWDHGQQAQALAALLVDRQDHEGWDVKRVTPLLAGLVELEPWLHQWYDEIDPEYGTSLAQDMTALLETRLSAAGLTREDARAWRPAERARGRRSTVVREGGAG